MFETFILATSIGRARRADARFLSRLMGSWSILEDGRLAALIAAARRRGSDRRYRVANLFDAGDAFGHMRQIEVGAAAAPAIFVTPIAELAFDRRHLIAREIADYRRRHAQTRVVASA